MFFFFYLPKSGSNAMMLPIKSALSDRLFLAPFLRFLGMYDNTVFNGAKIQALQINFLKKGIIFRFLSELNHLLEKSHFDLSIPNNFMIVFNTFGHKVR